MRAYPFAVFLWLLSIPVSGWSQQSQDSLWSYSARYSFATFLESHGQYKEAAGEWKACYDITRSDSAKWRYIRCLRYQHLYDSALKEIGMKGENNMLLHDEWLMNDLLAGKWPADSVMPRNDSALLKWLSLAISGNMEQAQAYYRSLGARAFEVDRSTDLNVLLAEVMSYKKHKAVGATLLSAAVPGLGKMATGHAVDGAAALVAVGVNTTASVLSFNKWGIRSFWGWLFGALAAGYYSGNIVGTHKAVKRDNDRKKDKIEGHALQIAHSYFIAH